MCVCVCVCVCVFSNHEVTYMCYWWTFPFLFIGVNLAAHRISWMFIVA